jgi:hypothetical protein
LAGIIKVFRKKDMAMRKKVLNLTWDAILFAAYAEASKEAFLPERGI